MTEPTVFVVDDDQAARESLCALVTSKGVSVEGFSSAEDFLQLYQPSRPGCVVLDVSMPGMNGLDLQRVLKDRGYLLPVIMISAYAPVPITVSAMERGAWTVLEKSCSKQELWQRIQEALSASGTRWQEHEYRQELANRYATLTEDESQVLQLLVDGCPNKQIAIKRDMGLRTVELRRARILEKMQANSLAELIRMYLFLKGFLPPNAPPANPPDSNGSPS